MQAQTRVDPWWAALTVWGVVNAVNLLQTAGFLSRVSTGSLAVNHLLGYGMIALAVPAGIALFAFRRARADPRTSGAGPRTSGADWRQWVGLVVYLAFTVFSLVVDYIWPVEFRSPARPAILAPYLTLFFGAILLMGLPMFRMNRRLWLVTVVTSILLLGSMGFAMYMGVG